MRRAIIVGAGTVAGLATVLVLNPDEQTQATLTPATSTQVEPGETSESTSPDAAVSGEQSDPGGTATDGVDTASGTFTGPEVQVRDWGVVQVEVTVTEGRITDVTALQVPDWDRRSATISSYAIPELVSQAVDGQSSAIAGVSGATFTSRGFAQSLQSALARAGLG